jgi:hypothetical protein
LSLAHVQRSGTPFFWRGYKVYFSLAIVSSSSPNMSQSSLSGFSHVIQWSHNPLWSSCLVLVAWLPGNEGYTLVLVFICMYDAHFWPPRPRVGIPTRALWFICSCPWGRSSCYRMVWRHLISQVRIVISIPLKALQWISINDIDIHCNKTLVDIHFMTLTARSQSVRDF